MWRPKLTRMLLIALLLTVSLPATGLAVVKIRDNTATDVGVVHGIEGRLFSIVLTDGAFYVPLRVNRGGFDSPDLAYFTTANCTGTSYVFANTLESGYNQIQNRTYVVRGAKSRLYRTRPNNPVVSKDFQSRYRAGACESFGSSGTSAVAADKLVRTLEDDYPPPYSIVGVP